MTNESASDLSNTDVFRVAPMMRYALGASKELVNLPLQESVCALSRLDATLASGCRQFAHLALHAATLGRRHTSHSSPVLDCLTKLANAGLLLSGQALLDRVVSFPEPESTAPLSWLAIPTLDRPAQLLRAVESYVLNWSQYGHGLDLLVADDSPSACRGRKLQDTLRRRLPSSGQAVYYLGPKEKRRLVSLLTGNTAIPREVVEFGVFGPSGCAPKMGANRNAILLATAGEMVLSVDDDTICEPCVAAGLNGDEVLHLGGEGDPMGYWPFADRVSALAFTEPVNVDVVRAHEGQLGRPLWTLFLGALANGRLDLSTACDHIIEGLWTGKGQVMVTLNGWVGDSGMYSQRDVMTHRDPETLRRLMASEENFRIGTQSREVLRHARGATVCHGGPMMSMFAGLDNREILPPFFPAFRSEDRVFGCVLTQCVDSCYFGYLPWAMVHAPEGLRKCQPDTGWVVRMPDLVCGCVSNWICGNRYLPTADRFRALGRHLTGIAGIRADDFREFLRNVVLRQVATRTAYEENLLSHYGGQPEYWANGLREDIEARLAAAVRRESVVPVELLQEAGRENSMACVQKLIRGYGELLYWWPEMVERAKALRAAGEVAAIRIDS